MARYVQPVEATDAAADITQRPIVAGQHGLTRSARAVTQSVAVVAAVMRSAKQPAVFVRGLMPSRLRRWWWKASDAAWNVVSTLAFVSGVTVVAFLAYLLVASAVGEIFG